MRFGDFCSPNPRTTVHTCPGCEDWQLDYDDNAVRQFLTWAPDGATGLTVRFDRWTATLEAVLREHLAECPPMQEVARKAGVA